MWQFSLQVLFLNDFGDEDSFDMGDVHALLPQEGELDKCPASVSSSSATVRHVRTFTMSRNLVSPGARHTGQAVGASTYCPWAAVVLHFRTCFLCFLLSSPPLLVHTCWCFLFKSLSSLTFILWYNTEVPEVYFLFSKSTRKTDPMSMGLSNPESSQILVYIQGTLRDLLLLLHHPFPCFSCASNTQTVGQVPSISTVHLAMTK